MVGLALFIMLHSPGLTPDRPSPIACAGTPAPWRTSSDVSQMPEAASAAQAGLQRPPSSPSNCNPEPPGPSAQQGPQAHQGGEETCSPVERGLGLARTLPARQVFPRAGEGKTSGPGREQEPSPGAAFTRGVWHSRLGVHAHRHRGASIHAGPAAGRLLQKQMWGGMDEALGAGWGRASRSGDTPPQPPHWSPPQPLGTTEHGYPAPHTSLRAH